MPPTVGYPPAKEGMEDEEGFFTCAVSVQHKVGISFLFFSYFLIFLLVLPLFTIPFSFQLELQQSCDISRMVSVLTFRGFTFIFYLLSLVCNLWENCPQQFAQEKMVEFTYYVNSVIFSCDIVESIIIDHL